MKKILCFIGTAAMFLAASCVKEQTPVTEPADNLVKVTFTADTEMAVKTSLHTDGKSVNWSEKDKISVFAVNEGAVVSHTAFAAENIDGTTADFTGATDADAADFVALYPYNSAAAVTVAEGVTTVKTKIPYVQKAVKGGFDTSLNLMLATTTKEAGHFSFKNLCSLFKVTIPAADEDDDLTKITALSINFREPAVGTFTYDLSTGLAAKSEDNGGKTVSIASEDGTPLQAGDYYFVISSHAAANYNGGKQGILWISATLTDGNVKTIQNDKNDKNDKIEVELSANMIYNVGEISLSKAKPDLTIDNAPVGPFPMGVMSYQLEWTFNDENTDNSKVEFSARNIDIATVDKNSGLVTFTGRPGPAHIHVNYKGYVYPVVFNVTHGYYRDTYLSWSTDTSGSTMTEGEGFATITFVKQSNNNKGRADIKKGQTYINPEYPILCFRLDDMKDKGYTEESIKLDVNYGFPYDHPKAGTTQDGRIWWGLTNYPAWNYYGTFGDGSKVLVFDTSVFSWPNVNSNSGYNRVLPNDEIVSFTNFKIVYADLATWDDSVTPSYRFFGFNTFKTLDEAKAFYGIDIKKR